MPHSPKNRMSKKIFTLMVILWFLVAIPTAGNSWIEQSDVRRNNISGYLRYQIDHQSRNLHAYGNPEPVSVILQTYSRPSPLQIRMLESLGAKIRSVLETIVTIEIPIEAVEDIAMLDFIRFIEGDRLEEPMLDHAVPEARADFVWQQGYTGSGVIVGVVDTGIDLAHGDFWFDDENTKILYLWDQTDESGFHPPEYRYGSEWTKVDIEYGIVPERDWNGHGTHVAGIAASSGLATGKYRGVAPDAYLIVVKTTFSTADIIDGMKYIVDKSKEEDKPAVINLSLGSHMSSHDGYEVQAQAVDWCASQGVLVVTAAGNEGDMGIHATIEGPDPNGGTYTTGDEYLLEAAFNGGDYQLEADLYYDLDDTLNIEVETRQGHLFADESRGSWEAGGGGWDIYVSFSEHPASKEYYILAEDSLGGPVNIHIQVEDQADTAQINTNRWDAWVDYGSFTDPHDYDNFKSIVSFANAKTTVSVGAYTTRTSWESIDGGIYSLPGAIMDEIAYFSSHGPTRDGRMKPEVTAPGFGIISALSSVAYTPMNYVDPDDMHQMMMGTSMATPMVTGMAALIMEAFPRATSSQVRSAIMLGAVEDYFTGSTWPKTENMYWGSGKLDGINALSELIGPTPTPSPTPTLTPTPTPSPIPTPTPTPPPQSLDLSILEMWLEPLNPVEGEEVHFYSTITNVGQKKAEDFSVETYLDSALYARHELSLEANESITIRTQPWTAVEGSHVVRWVVDSDDRIDELNETNNEESLSFMVKVVDVVTIDKVLTTDDRADVGSVQRVMYHAVWKRNETDVENGVLYVNGTGYPLNSSGWAVFETTSEEVGRMTWRVTGFDANGLYDYEQVSPDPAVIWDRIKVVDVWAKNERVDLGSEQQIYVKARYEYDGEPFIQGKLLMNGSAMVWEPLEERWHLDVSYQTVASYDFKVDGVTDDLYHLTVFDDEVSPLTMVWDRIWVELRFDDDRIDVGEAAVIGLDVYYEYESAPFTGDIKLNDTLVKDEVGRYCYTVQSIDDNLYGLNAFHSNVGCTVFDRVLIYFTFKDQRISVGETVDMAYRAEYEYDHTPFAGNIKLNDTLTKHEVGRFYYAVENFSDPLYDLSTYATNLVPIVFDRVSVTLYHRVEDWPYSFEKRQGIGTTADITYEAMYEYDETPFSGSVILNDTAKKDVVGRYYYTVEEVKDDLYGVDAYASNVISIIFDEIGITLSVPDDRVNVGSEANISWSGIYEYDGFPFKGEVALNDSTTKLYVGSHSYTVSKASDPIFGIEAYSSNTIDVIFDEVEIVLSTNQERVDAGSSANIHVEGTYLYDGSPYEGVIDLNENLTQIEVESYLYTVSRIHNDTYGINVFRSNAVSVIFDRVRITLSAEKERVEVGTEANITWRGIYEHDGSPFEGTVTLNDESIKDEVGKYYYTTESISDPTNGLTRFLSNFIAVIFDQIDVENKLESLIPGTIKVNLDPKYRYDGSPVTEAYVTVNGVEAMKRGVGHYETHLSTWKPYLEMKVHVEKEGFGAFEMELSSYHFGNILAIGALACSAIAVVIILVWRRRNR